MSSLPSRALARLHHFAARLLPCRCALCAQADANLLCERCIARYLQPAAVRCTRCAIDMTGVFSLCGRCASEPPAFDACFAAARYAPPIDQLVLALKFRAQLPLATTFARRIQSVVPAQALDGACVVMAVPLSAERLAARGFNQSLEIARPLARAWQLPLVRDACVRVRDTEPQSTLPLKQRRDNMRGAFAVSQRDAIAGKHVLVVDDVMTTGYTLDALAACLKRHGATRVTGVVFARTPPR